MIGDPAVHAGPTIYSDTPIHSRIVDRKPHGLAGHVCQEGRVSDGRVSLVRRKDGPLTPSFTGPPFNLSRSAVTRSDAGVTSSLDNSRLRSPRKLLRSVVARRSGEVAI